MWWRLFLFLILVIPFNSMASGAENLIKIATYIPDGSPYSTFGQEVVLYLEKECGDRWDFQYIETQGSVENVQTLFLDSETKLAICQEDVAHFFYTASSTELFVYPRTSDFTITSIGRLLMEELYIVVQPGINALTDIDALYVGGALSGSYATYTNLRRKQNLNCVEIQQGDRLQLFRDRDIDGFIEVASTPHTELLAFADEGVALQMLPVESTSLSLGLDIYSNTTVPDSLSPDGHSFRTASVPAVLLARRDLPSEIAEALLHVFNDPEIRGTHFPLTNSYIEACLNVQHRMEVGDSGIDSRFTDLPIPPHPVVVRFTMGRYPLADYSVALALLGFLVWLGWILPRYSDRLRRWKRMRPRNHQLYRDFLFVLFALFWAMICSWVIKYVEMQQLLSGRSLTGSEFLHMDLPQMLRWLTVFFVTGYTDHGFPLAPIAKIAAVSVKIVAIALLSWAGIRIITSLIEKLMERKDVDNLVDISEHIVICNWSAEGLRLIEELRNPEVPEQKRNQPICVVSQNNSPQIPEFDYEDLHHLAEDPWEARSLAKAHLERAESIIILLPNGLAPRRDEDVVADDGVVLRSALAIQNYFARGNTPVNGVPHVIAQFQRPPDEVTLKALGVNEIVASREIGTRLLAQTVTCPGISNFFLEILNSKSESNEVYDYPMPSTLCQGPADFWRVVQHFLAASAAAEPTLPIGIRLEARGNASEGEKEEHAGCDCTTLLNPSAAELTEQGVTRFVPGDRVLLLADNLPENLNFT